MVKVNKNQLTFENWWRKVRFNYYRGKGHLLAYIKNRIQWYWYPKLFIESKFPLHVDIEITNMCNLRCPMCYKREIEEEIGLMDFQLYKEIIDECAKNKLFSIRLSWRGEPTLHPKILDMAIYAKKKGIKEISFLTNGSKPDVLFSKSHLASLINYVDWITVSIDGLDKTYENIRKPLKFKDTLNLIKDLYSYKKFWNRKKPVIKVQSIYPAIKNNPLFYYNTFKKITDMVSYNKIKEYNKRKNIEQDPDFICQQPFQRLAIDWQGNYYQCICDIEGKTFNDKFLYPANFKDKSIKDFWQNCMGFIRLKHKNKERLELPPCQTCFDGEKGRYK